MPLLDLVTSFTCTTKSPIQISPSKEEINSFKQKLLYGRTNCRQPKMTDMVTIWTEMV